MQPIIIFSVVLLASVVASPYHSPVLDIDLPKKFGRFIIFTNYTASYLRDSTKTLRRDGVLHLYPFPRIGRASERTWEVPINDYLDHEQVKRQLYAFPRVGRSDLSQSDVQLSPQLEKMMFERRNTFDKRDSKLTSNLPLMWFGPRSGRAYKKEIDDLPLSDNESSEMQEETEYNREKRNTKLT